MKDVLLFRLWINYLLLSHETIVNDSFMEEG